MVTILKKHSKSHRLRITKLIEAERKKREWMHRQRQRFSQQGLATGSHLHLVGDDGADLTGRLEKARGKLAGTKIENLTSIMPLLFNLNGKPYTLADYFPFEPFYNTRLCRNMVWKTGRQVSKSTNQASQGVLFSNTLPYFHTLFVTPQFELIRRFSGNYVAPFITESPVRGLFLDSSCANNVLQRSFRNKSIMYFSFALLDCDRIRGLSCAKVAYDEVQDLDPAFIPIIREVMSASPFGISQYTGTPKTLDNTIESLWLDSSMAEWIIPCRACNHWNIPTLEHDLDDMLGPAFVEREISERMPAVVCAKCSRPINPRDGSWQHAKPELRFEFSGYHVPQLLMPMHYADPDKWAVLQGKRMGFGRTPINVFYNEVCGESFDHGTKLLTVTDLKAAATLHENDYTTAIRIAQSGIYTQIVLGVDWGGGGVAEDSFTATAVVGMLPNGKLEVIYGWRSLSPNEPIKEAIMVLNLLRDFNCSHLVHDFGGAGSLRETIIAQSGLPENRIIPVAYQRVGVGPMMNWKRFNERTKKRSHHMLDKARSLQYTCELIKHKYIRFFKYDHKGPDNPGLLHDFLSLVEDNVDNRHGNNIFTVIRNKKAGPDDFAHAVNMGACALFHGRDDWPDIALETDLHIDPSVLNVLAPISDMDWDDWP